MAVKLPVARRTLPFGLGTSCRDVRVVAMLAVVAIWPRISPGPFCAVWTLTYAVPPSIASSTASVRLPVPVSGLWHGPHRASTTGPGEPDAPEWMCAAPALPVRPLNASCHEIDAPPESDFVMLAANVPRALLTSPDGAGTSWAAFITVRTWIAVACGRAEAPTVAASATPSAKAGMSAVGLTRSSLLELVERLTPPEGLRGMRRHGFQLAGVTEDAHNAETVMKILDRAQSRIPQPWRTLVDWLVTIAVAVAFVLTFQAQVAKPYRIPSPSMEPTLHCAKPVALLPRAIQRPGDRQPACVQVR